MVTRAADRVMVDTNVLLAVTDEGRPEHTAALAVANDWPRRGTVLYASGQIIREYLVVATRPPAQNGLGLAVGDAVANARAILGRAEMLAEDSRVSGRLLALAQELRCQGKMLHDANVVATMLVHGVQALVTNNVGDFSRFSNHVRVLPLVD